MKKEKEKSNDVLFFHLFFVYGGMTMTQSDTQKRQNGGEKCNKPQQFKVTSVYVLFISSDIFLLHLNED